MFLVSSGNKQLEGLFFKGSPGGKTRFIMDTPRFDKLLLKWHLSKYGQPGGIDESGVEHDISGKDGNYDSRDAQWSWLLWDRCSPSKVTWVALAQAVSLWLLAKQMDHGWLWHHLYGELMWTRRNRKSSHEKWCSHRNLDGQKSHGFHLRIWTKLFLSQAAS